MLNKVYKILTSLIDKQSVLITNSGNKGFHIDIFLMNYMKRADIYNFYSAILSYTELSKAQLELRGASNQGYFIPFSFNFKNKEGDNYCYVSDEEGNRIHDEIEIIDNIKKLDNQKIYTIIDEYNEINSRKKQESREVKNKELANKNKLDNMKRSTYEIEKFGITEIGTRHNSALKLAILYRDRGHSEEEIFQLLIKWHKKLNKEFYKSKDEEAKEDYRRIARDIFLKKGDSYRYNNKNEITITKNDVIKVISIKVNKSCKYLYFAMLLQSKQYADKHGIFTLTYEVIQKMLNIKSPRDAILKQIMKLEEMKVIKKLPRGKFDTKNKKYPPNSYIIIEDDTELRDDKFITVKYRDEEVKELLLKCIDELMEVEEVMRYFSKKSWQTFIKR